MPFGLTIGTDRAMALQNAIQDELLARDYSVDADPVMAEYITIMVINNKSKANISSELEELIGSEFDPAFTDWIFEQAAKGANESEPQPTSNSAASEPAAEPAPSQEAPPPTSTEPSRRQTTGQPRNGVYQQAISQAIPTSAGNKRSASARSPSPTGHPNKSRRTDIPTGPRAMQREGPSNNASGNPRSLLDRMGGPAPRRNDASHNQHDDIQSRIDNITQNAPPEVANAMMNGGFPGMDMNAMAGMANPMMLQEMMMSQMALMAQMASSMGMLNNGGFVGGPGFPQGGMPQDMTVYQNQQQGQGAPNAGRGRGGGRGGRGNNRGRGGSNAGSSSRPDSQEPPVAEQSIAAPVPVTPTAAPSAAPAQPIPYALPERPQSPTLCKFGLKCTNAQCRYAHPSPVATAESGVVLSNEPCENGKDCKDKDCVKGHVSPAVLKPQVPSVQPTPQPAQSGQAAIPCRFGNACTRPGCPFAHPNRPASGGQYAQPCRFGAACTKATCPFQHPEGRVLPGTFHRGLATTGPMVNVPTPETGSMGANTSHNRSMTFNKSTNSSGLSVKEQMQQQLAEMEARKKAAEQALENAKAAAASKKDESAPITA